MANKLGTIPFQHAEWLSKNRLADPTVGSDSDGYLLQALTGGFHANFDGSLMAAETILADTTVNTGVVSVPGMTATGKVLVTFLADPGAGGVVLSHVVCGTNIVTFYQKAIGDATPTADVLVAATPVAIQVIAYSSTVSGTAMTTPPVNGMTGLARVNGGCNQVLFAHAAPNTITPANAIYGATAGFIGGRSTFAMVCVDENITPSNIGFSQKDQYFIPAATSFRFVCDINNWTNRTTLVTHAKAQIGVMAARHATFDTLMSTGPQAASASAIYVEFAESKMRLIVGTTASPYIAIPATLTSFPIRIEYIAGAAAFLYLDSTLVATVPTTTATTAMQVFARAGHLVAYVSATDDPISFGVDAVSVAIAKT